MAAIALSTEQQLLGMLRPGHILCSHSIPVPRSLRIACGQSRAGAYRGVSQVQGIQEVLGISGLLQGSLLAGNACAYGVKLLLGGPLRVPSAA